MTYGVKLQDLCVQKFGLHSDPFSRLFPKWTYNKFTIFSVSLRDQSSIEKKYLKKTKTFIPNILFFILSIYFNICTKVLVLLEVNEHSELMA